MQWRTPGLLLNVKENTNLGVAYRPDFTVYHHSPEDFSYIIKREDQEGYRRFAEKRGIDEVVDVDAAESRMVLLRLDANAEVRLRIQLGSGVTAPYRSATSCPVPSTGTPGPPLHVPTTRRRCRLLPCFLSFRRARRYRRDRGQDLQFAGPVDNQTGRRIGCLGDRALSLSYRVMQTRFRDRARSGVPSPR